MQNQSNVRRSIESGSRNQSFDLGDHDEIKIAFWSSLQDKYKKYEKADECSSHTSEFHY